MTRLSSNVRAAAALVLSAAMLFAQQPAPPAAPAVPQPAQPPPAAVYLLAPNDVIVIRAIEAEELSDKPFRIDQEGFVNLPLAGRLRAAGLTVEQFEASLTDALKKFIQEPQVVVTVIERPKTAEVQQPVYVMGAFRAPGVYPLLPGEKVSDMLRRAGGLQPGAARRVKLMRRADQGAIPAPAAAPGQDGKSSSLEIAVGPLAEILNAADDVELRQFDVLNVARLETVYVTGEVARSGALPVEDRDSLSVAQAISLAGGLSPAAKGSHARVLRPVLNTSRRAEIPVDVGSILAGKSSDFPLMPNDILFVPRSGSKLASLGKLLWVAIPAVITSVVYVTIRR